MENSTKKRGRPALWTEESKAALRALFPDLGDRALQNQTYANYAYKWTRDDPALAWLVEERDPGDGWKRKTILVELGRLRDPDLAREVGAYLCKVKPTVKEGAVMVRHYRLALEGKEPQQVGDPLGLLQELARTIDGYLVRYPKTPGQAILVALDNMRAIIEERAELQENGGGGL